MNSKLRYTPFSSYAILIEWPDVIDENTLQDVLNFKNRIENYYIKFKVEIIHTYNSLLIIYDFTIGNFNSKVLELKALNVGKKAFKERILKFGIYLSVMMMNLEQI